MTLIERFKKSVALGLVVTFVMTQNTPMTLAQAIQALVNTSDRPFLLQQIPSEFGRIQETHTGTNGKSVILIQDAHGSLPVQKNIRSLISYLNQQYGISLLLLEGAAQKLEPDLYRFYEEAEPSRLVGERLLERGELTGAEMFLLDQAIDKKCGKNCAEGQGAESSEVYARDLTLFREIISRDSELAAQLSTLSLLFQKKAGRILSPELLQFLKAVDQSETAEQALPETLQKINVQAQATLQLDFLNPRNQFEYPMLVRYFKLREMEGKIQVDASEAELQRLVKWLEANKAPQTLIKQIRELSPKTNQMRAVLEALVRVMQSKGFDFKDYPAWSQWAGMNALMQEVEPSALMKEMEQVIWKIVAKLAPKPEEKSILTLYRKTFYLRKLLTLSLASDEWQKIDSRRSELTPSRLWGEMSETKADANLDKAFVKAIQFYEAAKQREIHFIGNLQKQMQDKKQNHAVLVSGGFHQSGVLEKLKAAGYGYVSVMPNAGGFDMKESKKTYRRTMLETSQVASSLRIDPAQILANPNHRRAEIRSAMAGINSVVRPGTALDQRQSLVDGRRAVPVRSEARASYVTPKNFKEGVERFYAYKLEMLKTLQESKEEEFYGALNDFYQIVDDLHKPKLKTVGQSKLDDARAATNNLPADLVGHEQAEGVLREIEALGAGDGDTEYQTLKAKIIREMATELYPGSEPDQELIAGQLLRDIQTTAVRNMLPLDVFPKEKLDEWKNEAARVILTLSTLPDSWGHYSLVYKNIKVNPNPQSMTSKGAQSNKDRELILRSTIKHEAVHYLSDDISGRGRILKIPAEWEFLTYALDVMERVQHMPEGAKLDDYKDEFGDQALEALFERGRQYARDGGAGIEIKEGAAGGVGAGVFFDGLYAQAVLAYKAAGLSSTAFLNRYAGQRAVALVLGGFLHEKNVTDLKFGTLAYLKSIFDALDARQGEPLPEEKPHMEKVFAELQSYVSSLAGEQVGMRPVSGGFWRYESGVDGGAGELQYLPSDFRPRFEDGALEERIAAMRERVLGHALLALGRTNHARLPSEDIVTEDILKHPAFGIAWDAFNFPHMIQMTLTQLGFKKGLNETLRKGAVLWIHRVFSDRYSSQIPISFSKARLASMPLHLQYLDSLIYMFVNVKNEKRDGKDVFVVEDPRLENKVVLEELLKSFGDFEVGTENGWGAGKLFLDAGKLDLERFTQIFLIKVWPSYERLYQLALEQEMKKLEAANQVKEDAQAKAEAQKQFQQTAQKGLQQAQNQFQGQMQSGQTAQDSAGQGNAPGQSGQPGQAGGEAGQPGGQGGSEGLMQALQGGAPSDSEAGAKPGQGQSSSEPSPAGDKNPFKPFQKNTPADSNSAPSPDSPLSSGGDAAVQQGKEADSKGMQQMLTGLEQQLNGLSEKVQGLQSQLGQMGQNLNQMQNQASGLGAKAGDSGASEPQSGLAEALQSGASALDEGTQSLQQDASGVLQGAKSAVSQAKQAAAQQSWSSDALQAQNQSEQSVEEAQQLKDQAAKLQAMAQKIKKQIDQITKDLAATASPDVSTLSAQAAAVQKTIQDFKNQAAKMQGSAQSMDSTLEGLQSSVKGLQQAMQNLEGKESQDGPKTEDQRPTTSSGENGSPQSPGQSSPSSPSEQSASSEGGSSARFDLPSQATGLSGLTGIGAADGNAGMKASPKLKPFKPQGVSIEMDEKADAAKWGFTVDQWREYLSWKKEMVTVARGRKVQVSRLIDETKEFFDALLLPVRKTKEVGPYVEGDELGDDHLVDAAMGQPAMVDEVKKLPVLMSISIIFDRSGSMGWGTPGSEPIKLAKLIGFVLLEALFEHNEERETRGYRDQPLRFELGLFENDPTLLVSHETTQNTDPAKRSSKKIIYDLIKKLEAGGGTSFSEALGAFIERAKQDDDPIYTSAKAIRMLFAVTDEQVSDSQKSEVLGLIEDAKQSHVPVFIIPVGSAEERADSLAVHGEENVILAKPLSLLPQAIGAKMVTAVAEQYPSIPISEDVQSFARSEARGSLEKLETGTFDENGNKRYWNHFYTQKREGRDYLVWYDAENPDQMLAWERGPGGPQVPRMKIPPTKSNELFIKEVYKSLYRANSHFSSVSSDGKWLIRETGSGELELDQFDANVGRTMELMRSNRESLARIQVSENVYSNGTVWWEKGDVDGRLKISFDGKHFDDLDGIEIDADNITELEIQKATDQKIAVFDHRGGRIYLADKAKSDWKVTERLQLESQDLSNRWYRRLIEVTGETGLAKDVLMLAAAQLMNEQVFFIPINENLKEGELDWRRVLGLEGEGTTSDLPSALALAQEHGGWVLLREAHKMPEELWPLLKVKISDSSHKSLIGDTPVIRPDHPRFRMLASSNLARRNIQGAANRDQAVQRRKEAILKTWEWPQDEVMLQLEFARTFAIEQGTFHAGFDQEMGPVIERLVNTAVAQRLTFLGYSNRQQQELTKNRRSWDKLKDWDYAPDNKAGEMLKRAPSPRVIRNVVAHFVKYPKDLEHRPWSVIHGYYNFDAEVDRDKTYTRVETDFEKVGFQDHQKNETPVLKPESFKVLKNKDQTFSLEITPIETGTARWEKVVVPLHKDSELAKNPKALPKKLMGWLDLPENALTIYQMMQDYSLGKDTMLVGEQETGKSVLIEESQALVGKKPIQKIGITQHTKPKDITYQMDMKAGKTRFAKKPVAIAAEEGGPVHLEEANQAESLAVLNDLLDSRMLIDPLGNRVQIARGFVAWLSINPPGQGFLVNTFSDEFLERVAIRKVYPLPSARVRAYLEEAVYKDGKSVNSRFVGEELKSGNAGQWSGLIGLAQKIRELREADPQFLPRAPGPGTLESMVSDILDHYETNLADRNIYLKEELTSAGVAVPDVSATEIIRLYFAGAYDKNKKLKEAIALHMVRPQEVVRDMLLRKFTMQGKGASQNGQWVTHFTEAMEKVGLWTDTATKPGEDGVLNFLAGEELVAESYPVLRESKTGDIEMDTLLRYLQMYPKSAAFIGKADQILARIELLVERDGQGWSALEYAERLSRFSKLAQIHGVLATVYKARQKEMAAGNVQMAANGVKLKELSGMIQALVKDRKWPTYVLTQAEDTDFDASAELTKWLKIYKDNKTRIYGGVGENGEKVVGLDLKYRDPYMRATVFPEAHYKKEVIAKEISDIQKANRSEARFDLNQAMPIAMAGSLGAGDQLAQSLVRRARSESRGLKDVQAEIKKLTDEIAQLLANADAFDQLDQGDVKLGLGKSERVLAAEKQKNLEVLMQALAAQGIKEPVFGIEKLRIELQKKEEALKAMQLPAQEYQSDELLLKNSHEFYFKLKADAQGNALLSVRRVIYDNDYKYRDQAYYHKDFGDTALSIPLSDIESFLLDEAQSTLLLVLKDKSQYSVNQNISLKMSQEADENAGWPDAPSKNLNIRSISSTEAEKIRGKKKKGVVFVDYQPKSVETIGAKEIESEIQTFKKLITAYEGLIAVEAQITGGWGGSAISDFAGELIGVEAADPVWAKLHVAIMETDIYKDKTVIEKIIITTIGNKQLVWVFYSFGKKAKVFRVSESGKVEVDEAMTRDVMTLLSANKPHDDYIVTVVYEGGQLFMVSDKANGKEEPAAVWILDSDGIMSSQSPTITALKSLAVSGKDNKYGGVQGPFAYQNQQLLFNYSENENEKIKVILIDKSGALVDVDDDAVDFAKKKAQELLKGQRFLEVMTGEKVLSKTSTKSDKEADGGLFSEGAKVIAGHISSQHGHTWESYDKYEDETKTINEKVTTVYDFKTPYGTLLVSHGIIGFKGPRHAAGNVGLTMINDQGEVIDVPAEYEALKELGSLRIPDLINGHFVSYGSDPHLTAAKLKFKAPEVVSSQVTSHSAPKFKIAEKKFKAGAESLLIGGEENHIGATYLEIDKNKKLNFYSMDEREHGFFLLTAKEKTGLKGITPGELISAKHELGTSNYYFVVVDSVDLEKMKKDNSKSSGGSFQFKWIHQSDAESAEGYAKYKDKLDYEPIVSLGTGAPAPVPGALVGSLQSLPDRQAGSVSQAQLESRRNELLELITELEAQLTSHVTETVSQSFKVKKDLSESEYPKEGSLKKDLKIWFGSMDSRLSPVITYGGVIKTALKDFPVHKFVPIEFLQAGFDGNQTIYLVVADQMNMDALKNQFESIVAFDQTVFNLVYLTESEALAQKDKLEGMIEFEPVARLAPFNSKVLYDSLTWSEKQLGDPRDGGDTMKTAPHPKGTNSIPAAYPNFTYGSEEAWRIQFRNESLTVSVVKGILFVGSPSINAMGELGPVDEVLAGVHFDEKQKTSTIKINQKYKTALETFFAEKIESGHVKSGSQSLSIASDGENWGWEIKFVDMPQASIVAPSSFGTAEHGKYVLSSLPAIWKDTSTKNSVVKSKEIKQTNSTAYFMEVDPNDANGGNWEVIFYTSKKRKTLYWWNGSHQLDFDSKKIKLDKNPLVDIVHNNGVVELVLDEGIKTAMAKALGKDPETFFAIAKAGKELGFKITFADPATYVSPNIARSESRDVKPEMPAVTLRAGELSAAEIAVAEEAAQHIFSVDAMKRAAERVKKVLRAINPGWFADKARIDTGKLLDDSRLMDAPIKIGRIYKELPSLDSPEVNFLVDYLASNPRAELMLSAAETEPRLGHDFVNLLTKQVNQQRKKLDPLAKGFKLKLAWVDSTEDLITRFDTGEAGITSNLLFSDLDGKQLIAVSKNVLTVHNDKVGESEATVAGLAAGLKELFLPNKPTGWVNASSLLEYISLLGKVSEVFAQSA